MCIFCAAHNVLHGCDSETVECVWLCEDWRTRDVRSHYARSSSKMYGNFISTCAKHQTIDSFSLVRFYLGWLVGVYHKTMYASANRSHMNVYVLHRTIVDVLRSLFFIFIIFFVAFRCSCFCVCTVFPAIFEATFSHSYAISFFFSFPFSVSTYFLFSFFLYYFRFRQWNSFPISS